MDASKNRGTPKSSILIGFFIIHHPFWGTPIFGNTQICTLSFLTPDTWAKIRSSSQLRRMWRNKGLSSSLFSLLSTSGCNLRWNREAWRNASGTPCCWIVIAACSSLCLRNSSAQTDGIPTFKLVKNGFRINLSPVSPRFQARARNSDSEAKTDLPHEVCWLASLARWNILHPMLTDAWEIQKNHMQTRQKNHMQTLRSLEAWIENHQRILPPSTCQSGWRQPLNPTQMSLHRRQKNETGAPTTAVGMSSDWAC